MTKWWKLTLVMCLRTVAQTAIASIGTAAVLQDVDWILVASAAVLAGVLCLLMRLAVYPTGSK